jgi:CRP/FNR family transcriptional regulator
MDIRAELKSILPFWDKLEIMQRDKLAESAAVRRFKRGETFHRGAETCSGLYIVLSGHVRVYLLSESGREITLYRLFERDICLFTASCMMSDVQFDVYVQAEKDTEAILIPTAVYEWLMEDSIHVARYTNSLMASRFSDVMWLIEQVLFKSFDSRLAAFLTEQSVIGESGDL